MVGNKISRMMAMSTPTVALPTKAVEPRCPVSPPGFRCINHETANRGGRAAAINKRGRKSDPVAKPFSEINNPITTKDQRHQLSSRKRTVGAI